MSAADVLRAVRAAGISVEIDGDDLVLGAAGPPSPAVLELLSRNKADIIAALRAKKRAEESTPFETLRPTVQAQEKNRIKAADAKSQGTTAYRSAADASDGSQHEDVEALRGRIIDSLDRLPPPCDPNGRRLITATRSFAGSPWFSEALKHGWSLEELFGVDGCAPLDNYDRWGLVVGIALHSNTCDVIEKIDEEQAVMRGPLRGPIKPVTRTGRRFAPTASSVVWWKCSALVGEVD